MISINLQKTLQGTDGTMDLKVDLLVKPRSLVTLYGHSGAGKTSLLRMIAGLMNPDEGSIELDSGVWYDSRRSLNKKPQGRSVGFVFQEPTLFPNMTVIENLRYALAVKNDPAIITDLLHVMEINELRDRKPDTLSGGQKQRVALARALVRKPELLLLDEPLSAVDHALRSKLQDLILQVHRQFNLTTFLVSHEPGEVLRLSDYMITLEQGKVIRQGTPQEIFSAFPLSGKFQFTGEVVTIAREDVVYVISVLIGNTLVKVVADASEAANLAPGDKVLVASKAFNPVIVKLG